VDEIIQMRNDNPFWRVIPSEYTEDEIKMVRDEFSKSPTWGPRWTVWGHSPYEQKRYGRMAYFLTRIDMNRNLDT
jgi:hypothetical protein